MSVSELDVTLGTRVVPVKVRRNRRARRITLRLDADGTGAIVTIPSHAHTDDALDMVRRHATWLDEKLATAPTRVPFHDGAEVPFLGDDHIVRHVPGRRPVARADGEIHVSGAPEHLPRRLTDWFKAQARQAITQLADDKADVLGVTRGRITVRDTRSRWGSCAVGGNLSFSWRLVMAPDWVLDYVVAHEVAHIAHHHHGPEFWAAVAGLTDHAAQAKTWLTKNGQGLHLYG